MFDYGGFVFDKQILYIVSSQGEFLASNLRFFSVVKNSFVSIWLLRCGLNFK